MSTPPGIIAAKGRHRAAFYQTDHFIVDTVSSFVSDGLSAGERVIVLATLSHWNTIAARLEERGVDYGRAVAHGRLVLIDAEHVLESITRGEKHRIYGELVSLLADKGDVDSAIAIEALGTDLAQDPNLAILCGYHAGPLSIDDRRRVEQAHDGIV